MINHKYLFAISFCIAGFCSNISHAQKPLVVIDSLKVLLSTSADTVQANLYNQIGWQYRNINFDSAYFYSKKGHDLSSFLGYLSGKSHGLNYMGIAMRNQSRYYEAMQFFFNALKVAEESRNIRQISYSLVNIGNIYLYQTNYEGAFQYFNRSLQNAQELNDDRLSAYCHLNMARSYKGLIEYPKAKYHLSEALKIRKSALDFDGIAIANLELADLYFLENKLDSALYIIKEIFEKVIYLGHQNTLADSYVIASKVYLKQGKLKLAFEDIQKCLIICKSSKLKNTEVQALKVLSEIYELKKQPEEALLSLKRHLSNKDSIFNAVSSQKIADLFSKYTYEKSETEKTNLKAKTELNEMIIRRQRAIIILSVVIIFSFVIIASIAYRSSLVRKRLNDQIQTQKDIAYKHNNELIDINNEKNNLIRILSHDLRAPITNIKGLTQVHQMDHQFTESENKVLNLIKSESDRLLNMITKILNVEALDEKREIEYEKIDFNKVAHELVDGFENTAKTKEIEIKSTFLNNPTFIIGDEIHLHQIMENLLSNALKFTEKGKTIAIEISVEKEKVRACFSDQGPGLTKDDKDKIFKKFQTLSAKPTNNEESTGLGLSIVKKYVNEMNGHVWYESTLGEGTSFFIEFDRA